MAHRPDGNGKGDTPRPFSVDYETFGNSFDSIFGKKTKVYNESGDLISITLNDKDGNVKKVLWERDDG